MMSCSLYSKIKNVGASLRNGKNLELEETIRRFAKYGWNAFKPNHANLRQKVL